MQLPRTSLVVALAGPALLIAAPAQAAPSDAPKPTATASATPTPIGTREVAGKDISLSLRSVPPEFVAGGDWGTFTVVVDVKGDEPVTGRPLGMQVEADEALKIDSYVLEMFDGSRWRSVTANDVSDDWTAYYYLPPLYHPFPAGRTEVQVRMRFREEAELQSFRLQLAMSDDPDTVEPSQTVFSRVVAPPAGGGDPTPGPDPEPDPDPDPEPTPSPTSDPDPDPEQSPSPTPDPEQTSRPAPDPGAGSGQGPGAGGGAAGPEQQDPPGSGPLASTGADAATAWALGGAGVAFVAGGALLVRYRRGKHHDDGSAAA
ncbi:LPXTG cell wall anchor domain-containing protein [Streptomyces sp. PvR034]|uniref:LPXTG cell wall anchor domain-containing protein n=1 Tax=Streptomyces sp. PvR034 TaxID=3156401 RepID=UPI00339A69C9